MVVPGSGLRQLKHIYIENNCCFSFGVGTLLSWSPFNEMSLKVCCSLEVSTGVPMPHKSRSLNTSDQE